MKGEECLYIFMPFIVISGGIFIAYVWIVLHKLYVQPLLDRRKQKSPQRSESAPDTGDIELGTPNHSNSAEGSSSNPPSTSQVSVDTEQEQQQQQQEELNNTGDTETPPKYTTQA